MYEAKFNQLYKGKTYVEIEIIDETPLTTMYCRYNQSRMVCSSMEESSIAKLKDKNGVKQIECDTFNCQYRQKNEQGKMACNRKGWLRFVIPTISRNGVFIMQISSQESINNLYDYFTFQKCQGLSIKGRYILFLKQKEQTNSLGQTFNNFILNIIPKEDFIQANQNPQKTENTNSLSTTEAQNVNNDVEKKEISPNSITNSTNKVENTNVNVAKTEITDVKKAKKTTKSSTTKSKKTAQKDTREIKITENEKNNQIISKPNDTESQEITNKNEKKEDNLNDYFVLIDTFMGKIKDKNGIDKDYLIGNFHDMNDNSHEIVIRPQDAEIANYGMGTTVKLDIKEVLQRKFAMSLEYITKMEKEKVA